MRQVFAEPVLRRFPLSRTERLAARQLLGLVEPMWLATLGLYIGCAVGVWVFGGGYLWLVVATALLLLITNYLLAQVVLALADRIFASPGRSLTVLLLMNVALFAGLGLRAAGPASGESLARLTSVTPPLLAAAVMTGTNRTGERYAELDWL